MENKEWFRRVMSFFNSSSSHTFRDKMAQFLGEDGSKEILKNIGIDEINIDSAMVGVILGSVITLRHTGGDDQIHGLVQKAIEDATRSKGITACDGCGDIKHCCAVGKDGAPICEKCFHKNPEMLAKSIEKSLGDMGVHTTVLFEDSPEAQAFEKGLAEDISKYN